MTQKRDPTGEKGKSERQFCGNCIYAPFKHTPEQKQFLQETLAVYGIRRFRNQLLKRTGIFYRYNGKSRLPDPERTQIARLIQKPGYCHTAEAQVRYPELPCARYLPGTS